MTARADLERAWRPDAATPWAALRLGADYQAPRCVSPARLAWLRAWLDLHPEPHGKGAAYVAWGESVPACWPEGVE